MELYKIALRVLFAYVFLVALLRVSGKRTVAQGTGFDFVAALILGDMIDDMLWAEVPASQFVVGATVIVMAQIGTSLASRASKTVGRLLEGEPRMIMRDGTMLKRAMRRECMNEKEVEEMLRQEGLDREHWPQVKSAWVEDNGRPGVLKHDWAKTVQKQELDRVREAKR